ncbi:ferrous iron transport protein A [Clostridium aciditolerans]|uniref:Ferrous iron transport protein A n=1 Tax=Clostridium aciditolerans TaxID=339861 RepID=A0A934I1U2_9CLOT|nr:FeoA family protein [Clostridium aciditolerans]MBI6874480.1 ferrous iron transport protein A [Clostridium aciditolerans]
MRRNIILELNSVSVGNYVTVEDLSSTGMLRERMLALGLTKGARIEVVRRGPSGDPTVYNIRGAMIALRKEEASLISVTHN